MDSYLQLLPKDLYNLVSDYEEPHITVAKDETTQTATIIISTNLLTFSTVIDMQHPSTNKMALKDVIRSVKGELLGGVCTVLMNPDKFGIIIDNNYALGNLRIVVGGLFLSLKPQLRDKLIIELIKLFELDIEYIPSIVPIENKELTVTLGVHDMIKVESPYFYYVTSKYHLSLLKESDQRIKFIIEQTRSKLHSGNYTFFYFYSELKDRLLKL